MSTYITGVILTLLSSVSWAAGVMFFRKSGETVTAFGVNVGKNVIGILLFSITIPLVGGSYFPSSIPARDLWLIVISGVLGVGMGDLLFLAALKMLGAGLNSIVGAVYTPLLVFGAVIFLGEPLSLSLILGTALVVIAIFVIATDKIKTRPKNLYLGIFTGIMGMFCTVAGILLMKGPLMRHSLWWINWARLISGLLFFALYFPLRKDKQAIVSSLTHLGNWKTLALGGMLGTYFAILFWTGGLSILPASVVGVLNQLTIVAIIVFARIFLKEPVTLRKVMAGTLACSGAFLATSNIL
ncbi:DMT family transporter [Myxococcota bacterium]|nr:DMT family transporter [Myxococcota bacterium]MBU1538092.1 DMT family transporter [Myxococcota bacterium]